MRRPPVEDAGSLSAEEFIRRSEETPIGQSIGPLAELLVRSPVYLKVPADGESATGETEPTARPRFATAKDNDGRTWASAYTSEAEFERAFPLGTRWGKQDFPEFFRAVEHDPQFAGINLNAGSAASFLIPREVYGSVAAVLPH